MDMQKIGKFIAARRNLLGYTQDAFGDVLGVTGKAVSKWERGLSCPDVYLLNRIAVELKISVAQLLEGKAEELALSSNSINQEEPDPFYAPKEYCEVELAPSGQMGTVSPFLFGNNLEHTRSSVCGGISAQMLRNRKFVGKPSAMEGVAGEWYRIGEMTFCSFGDPYTRHVAEHYHMHRNVECNSQRISNYAKEEESGIGQHGICVSKGKKYDVAIVAQAIYDMEITVSLTSRGGKKVYAQSRVSVSRGETWNRYTTQLISTEGDDEADFRVTFQSKGCITVGCLSLMPAENFRGMRWDVIDAMKEVGDKMDVSFRETALGGLAATPAGMEAAQKVLG